MRILKMKKKKIITVHHVVEVEDVRDLSLVVVKEMKIHPREKDQAFLTIQTP
jgi:hypothetical protein